MRLKHVKNIEELSKFVNFRFRDEVKAHKILPAEQGEYVPLPENLEPGIKDYLKSININALYSHQSQAYESILSGQDTLISSRTASGKTLSFFLPILQDYIESEGAFTTLLLYPTKALSRDQEGILTGPLSAVGKGQVIGTFDGDTPRDERENIQRKSDFIISNPDMLHGGVLPNHFRRWRSFLSRLKYIVVDEVHSYRGTFGSHVANVFRRLLRVCELHGSYPTFVGLSATVGNPKEHCFALFSRPFHIIKTDGSPRPDRELFFLNPRMQKSMGGTFYRKGTGSVSIHLIREATLGGIRTICFCRSRQQVERLYRAVTDGYPQLKKLVRPYRGGLLPSERRQLESDLFSGKTTTIITTNALELGIDIGNLDLCILSGHPGSISSFWQQAGRVGRSGKRAMIAFIAKDTPINQYFIHHPEFLFQANIEQAWLNATNPYILLQHLPCAAQEVPISFDDPIFSDMASQLGLKLLCEQKILATHQDYYHFIGKHYPSRGVNLRGMTDYNIEIHCGSIVIGEIDPIGARGELYKDAIYQHLGRRYMSLDLDLQKKLCLVAPVEVDYYTEAVWEVRVTLEEEDTSKELALSTQMIYGSIHVHREPKLYKKIRERTLENIGYGPITLDPFEFRTMGLALTPSRKWTDELGKVDKRYISTALFGLRYLLKKLAPSFCMADFRDIDTDVAYGKKQDEKWKTTLFLYDNLEGGVGHSEKIYELFCDILKLCRQVLDECECEYGCPSCVPPSPPGVEDQAVQDLLASTNSSVVCTKSIINCLLEGKIEIPQVKKIEHESRPENSLQEDNDREWKQMQGRLQKAAKILQLKQERTH